MVRNLFYLLGRVGKELRLSLAVFADLLGLMTLTLRQLPLLMNPNKRQVFWFLFKRQLFNSGFKAAYINCILAITVGLISAHQLLPLTGNLDAFSRIYSTVILLELAPMVSGVILIARSATAISAEIGYLRLNNEFDVLKVQNINPIFLFMLPVFFAFPVSLFVMLVYFGVFSILSTWFYLSFISDLAVSLVGLTDAMLKPITSSWMLTLSIKSLTGGILIALVSIYSGMRVNDRFTDVSRAIANCTTTLLLSYFMLNIALSVLAY